MSSVHRVSVCIPVYQGAKTLPALFAELAKLTGANQTPNGNVWTLDEVICAYDHGHDDSPVVLQELERQYDFLKIVWLSRNFGQHPATLAAISASGGEWVVTIDEDGQQNPCDISVLLDQALRTQSTLVYAKPLNKPPHGIVRNFFSRTAKKIVDLLMSTKGSVDYNSFRLILGEVARSAAAYAGSGVYLDVALGWVAKVTTAGVYLREEGDRKSGYSLRTLFAHFWRMVLSSGTGILRIVSILGILVFVVGVTMSFGVFIYKLLVPAVQIGWSSTIITILLTTGLIMLFLGIIAEYIGVAVSMAMGKPLYLVTGNVYQDIFAKTAEGALNPTNPQSSQSVKK